MRVRVRAPESERDRLSGELFELGTLGLEEREGEILAYFSDPEPLEALRRLCAGSPEISIDRAERVPDQDWNARSREGLVPRRVGPLWIRPSWCASAGAPEIVLDPAQGFGSGEHASTRLALGLLLEALEAGDRVLDAGTGSGILALGALRCGAAAAIAFDLDPDACREAHANAGRNALRPRVYCGPLAALRARERFEIVVANLLLHELEPELPALIAHTGRALVLSGQLAAQRSRLIERVTAAGPLRLQGERTEPQSGDLWYGSRWG